MAGTAERTDPKLWDKVKGRVTQGDRGGEPGQWSARKAQLAVAEYKKAGGGYKGAKAADNHLRQWTKEKWGTKSGKPSGETGERYLPQRALNKLTDREYAETTAKKRADARAGRQFSAQPKAVAKKTARLHGPAAANPARAGGNVATLGAMKRDELVARARRAGVPATSRLRKDELVRALGG